MRFARRGAVSGLAIVDAMEESAGSGFRLHAGLKAAIAQGTVAAFLAEYRSTLLRGARQSTIAARDYSLAQQLTTFGGALVVSVLLLVGVRVLALPFAVLVTSLVIFARMSGPGQLVQNSIVRAAAFSPAFTAIERRLGKLDWNVPDQRARDPVDWNELRLEAVRLEHQPGLGVGGVSLTLKPGEWLGISGASGAGKTTLVDLAAGLLVPESGQVTVDGRALAGATLDGWSATLAYVGQEGSVFNDSVRGNLLAEGASASDTDLWQALETVGLAARVRAFPNDLDHPVGDRGSHLSGGERQRLVLARALLRRPTFLILDEATAALDPESEGALIDRLKALQPKPAALVVAHRASTLTHCDSVLSIQHGVVSADA
jgi:ATP-binding cassette subfamily C protein